MVRPLCSKTFFSKLLCQADRQVCATGHRPDTWSLGVCNGCQLMALLGWVPGAGDASSLVLPDIHQPRFVHNSSGRFESRWAHVTIMDSPSVFLKVLPLASDIYTA